VKVKSFALAFKVHYKNDVTLDAYWGLVTQLDGPLKINPASVCQGKWLWVIKSSPGQKSHQSPPLRIRNAPGG